MKEQSRAKKILSSAVTFLIAVVVIASIAVAMGAVGIPLWPFIFLLFFYSSVDGFNPQKFTGTALGGFIGIFVGMSQGIFTQLLGNPVAGIVCYALLALVLGTAFIMGDVPWANVFGLLLMTLLSLFTLEPNVWAAVADKPDMGSIEAFVRVIASYAVAVVLFIIVNSVIKKKAAAAAAAEETR